MTARDDLSYPPQAWEEELYRSFGLGADPEPCPRCGRTGFYGPRFAEPNTCYRACRFCGFWQVVDEAPERAQPCVHGCRRWPRAARALYIWWVSPAETRYTCPFCREEVAVADTLVTAPADDADHPWWRVPQGRDHDYYTRFWANWKCTKGRAFY